MMDADDVENGQSISEEKVAAPAVRRQNKWFACAITFSLLGGAAFVLVKNNTSPSELPVDMFDNKGGEVGESAPNGKLQEAVQHAKGKGTTHHTLPSKNPFTDPYQSSSSGSKNHKADLQNMIDLRRNRTNIKQMALLERWNRTHPGQAFPSRLNHTLAHDRIKDWTPGGHKSKNPLWSQHKPTKTNENAEDEQDVEDGHHEMDQHEVVDDPPAEGHSNVFGTGGSTAAAPEKKKDVDAGTQAENAAKKTETPDDVTNVATGDAAVTGDAPIAETESTKPPVVDVSSTEGGNTADTEGTEFPVVDATTTDGGTDVEIESTDPPVVDAAIAEEGTDSEPDSTDPPAVDATTTEDAINAETKSTDPPVVDVTTTEDGGNAENESTDPPAVDDTTTEDAVNAKAESTDPPVADAPTTEDEGNADTESTDPPAVDATTTEDGDNAGSESTDPPVADAPTTEDGGSAETETTDPPVVDDTTTDGGDNAGSESTDPPVADAPTTEDEGSAETESTDPPVVDDTTTDGGDNAGSDSTDPPLVVDPNTEVRQEETNQKDAEVIAEEVLEHEEAVEKEDKATDKNKADAQDIEAWHAAKVDKSSGVMFEVVEQLTHDHQSFTQGLTYANGVLFESAGLYSQSTIRILDPDTGEATKVVPMDTKYFAEGMTFYDNKLVQIVWKLAKGFVYDANDLTAPPIEYDYTTVKKNEGWGITYDNDRDELIVTDGSEYLIFWDPDCWKTGKCEPKEDKPPVAVTRLDGSAAKELNEIEYWRGRVLANVWFSDVLLVINPETGIVEKEYDFSTIFPKASRPRGTDVFNGISVSENPDILYVTGKKWDRMFKVKLLV